jgi:hypothetical protein
MELRKYSRKTMSNASLEVLFKLLAKPENMFYNVDMEKVNPVKFFNQKRVHLWFILDDQSCLLGCVWITKHNALNQTGWGNLAFTKYWYSQDEYDKGCEYLPSDMHKYEVASWTLKHLMRKPEYRMLYVEVTDPEGLEGLGFKKVGDIPEARWNHAKQKYEDVEMWYIRREN